MNKLCNKGHEHVPVKFNSDELATFGGENQAGGISGTLRPGSMCLLVDFFCGGTSSNGKCLPEEARMTKDSVALDVGSGTGRFPVYVSWLQLGASVGFECCPFTHYGSVVFANRMESITAGLPRSPVILLQRNLKHIVNFGPATHVYSFIAYPEMLLDTALAAAKSKAALVLAVVLTHTKYIKDHLGLSLDDEDIAIQHGLTMPGGRQYTAVYLHLTKSVKTQILKFVTAGSGGSGSDDIENDDESDAGADFGDEVEFLMTNPEKLAEEQAKIIDAMPESKKSRRASNALRTKKARFDQNPDYFVSKREELKKPTPNKNAIKRSRDGNPKTSTVSSGTGKKFKDEVKQFRTLVKKNPSKATNKMIKFIGLAVEENKKQQEQVQVLKQELIVSKEEVLVLNGRLMTST